MLRGDGRDFVPLDDCVETMRRTGLGISEKYKETGGLAVNVVECRDRLLFPLPWGEGGPIGPGEGFRRWNFASALDIIWLHKPLIRSLRDHLLPQGEGVFMAMLFRQVMVRLDRTIGGYRVQRLKRSSSQAGG